jgi:hypothetical protein
MRNHIPSMFTPEGSFCDGFPMPFHCDGAPSLVPRLDNASSISAALAVTVEQIPYPASSSVCIEAGLLLQAATLACSCRHMQSSSRASTLGIAALVDLVGI